MAIETVVDIKWKPDVFREIAEGKNRADVAKTLGVSHVMLEKLIQGKRKMSIDKLINTCLATNLRPDNFFEIVVKK